MEIHNKNYWEGTLDSNTISTDSWINNAIKQVKPLLQKEVIKTSQSNTPSPSSTQEIQIKLYNAKIIKICPYADWIVKRKSQEIESTMKLISINAHLCMHLKFLEESNVLIENEKNIFLDLGSGDGTSVREILKGYKKRPDDQYNQKVLRDHYDAFGITREYLFSLDDLLISILNEDYDNNGTREFIKIISNLLIQKMNMIQDYEFPPEINDPDQDLLMIDSNINIIKKIMGDINTYNVFDTNNIRNIRVSDEFPLDTQLNNISEECKNLIQEIIDSPKDFCKKYFSFTNDLREKIAIHRKNIILGDFQNLSDIFSQYNFLVTVANASKSFSHLENNDYVEAVKTLCANLKPGGVIRDDGIIESYTRFCRHKELRRLFQELGSEYRCTVVAAIEGKPLLARYEKLKDNIPYLTKYNSPVSIIIQKALNTTEGKKFYSENEIKEITNVYDKDKKAFNISTFDLKELEKYCPHIPCLNALIHKFKEVFQQYELVSLHKNPDKELYKARTHFGKRLHNTILDFIFINLPNILEENEAPELESSEKENHTNNVIRSSVEDILKEFRHLENMHGLKKEKIKFEYENTPLEIDYFYREAQSEIKHGTLFYIHGLGCSKREFMESIPHEELSHYNLVAIDLPGFGNSPYPEAWKDTHALNTLTITKIVEIIHKITQELQLDKFIYVGHSMGGLIGLEYALMYPDQLTAFINIEGDLDPADNKLSSSVIALSKRAFTETMFNVLQNKLSKKKNKGFYKYAQLMHRAADPYAYYDYSRAIVGYSQQSPGFISIGNHSSLFNKFLEIENLHKIPTLYMYGDKTGYSSIAHLKNFEAQVACIKNSEHFPMYDNPQDFYRKIIEFTKQVTVEPEHQ